MSRFKFVLSLLVTSLVVAPAFFAKDAAAEQPEKYGTAIETDSPAASICDILAKPADYIRKEVVIEGTIMRVCGSGRWLWLKCAQKEESRLYIETAGIVRTKKDLKTGKDVRLAGVPPRMGAKVRVFGVVQAPRTKEGKPSMRALGVELTPVVASEDTQKLNVWKCECSGKTWEQPAEETKSCPYCGSSMPDCGTLEKTYEKSDESDSPGTRATPKAPEIKEGCFGCKPTEETKPAGGCGGCESGAKKKPGKDCAKEMCKDCRGDDETLPCYNCRPEGTPPYEAETPAKSGSCH